MTDKKTAVIVIPTYNEAGTIGEMIDHLFNKTFPTIKGWECKLLVVDAQSPDGTAGIVRAKQSNYDNLDLFVEKKKEGIGAAYVKGFRYAMDKMSADVLIEFDGDFQHPPDRIPLLLEKIDQGYDYVLGSRKVKGGSYPENWEFKRLFFSKIGGLVARVILFLPTKNFLKITDPTTGLKASRVKGFVDQMDMDDLFSQNFGYKLEFLFKMVTLGANVVEIPLNFHQREEGESKMTSSTSKDILRSCVLLRANDKESRKFVKFGIVGTIGFIVNSIGLIIFGRLELTEWLVWGLATEMAIISNFTWDNLWTFGSEKFTKLTTIIPKFLQFNLTSVGALLIQTTVGTLLSYTFGTEYRLVYLPFIIVFLIIPYNWTMYNKVIWKKDD